MKLNIQDSVYYGMLKKDKNRNEIRVILYKSIKKKKSMMLENGGQKYVNKTCLRRINY